MLSISEHHQETCAPGNTVQSGLSRSLDGSGALRTGLHPDVLDSKSNDLLENFLGHLGRRDDGNPMDGLFDIAEGRPSIETFDDTCGWIDGNGSAPVLHIAPQNLIAVLGALSRSTHDCKWRAGEKRINLRSLIAPGHRNFTIR